MTRYFLVISGPISVGDTEGAEFPSLDAALEEARQTARVLLAEGRQIGRNRADWRVRVEDAARSMLGEIRFGDVPQASVRPSIAPGQDRDRSSMA